MNFRNVPRRMRREAHLCNYLGQDTTARGVQAQPRTHQSEAVASGASQGAAAPWVRPQPQHRHSGPPRSGSCMEACKGASGWLPCLAAPNRACASINTWARLSSPAHNILELHLNTTSCILFIVLVLVLVI